VNHSGNDATDIDVDPLPRIPETGIDLFVGSEALLQQAVTLVTHDQRTHTVIVGDRGVGTTSSTACARASLKELAVARSW